MKHYQAPWNATLKMISFSATTLLLIIPLIIYSVRKDLPTFVFWQSLILPLVILLACACFVVRGYVIEPDAILIRRLFWTTRLPRVGLKSARSEPNAMRGSIRTFGNGGLFSFTGLYRNQLLGSYRAFVTNTKQTVVLEFPDSTVVVSPESPEEFVRELGAPSYVPGNTTNIPTQEIFQTPETPPRHVFLMKRTLIPALVLALFCLGYVMFVADSASLLPEPVATHFGANGQPNGWMERESYLHFITILGLALAFLMAGLGFVLGMRQARLKPAARRAGTTPKRLNQNSSWLCGDMCWLACLILCFIAGTHYLTIQANRSHPVQLPMSSLTLLMAAFGVGTIGWTILLILHLIKKSDSRAGSN